ncbi:MAG: formate dehydrogenase accessory sulfurtransferase FdhD [candidate division KSB1 bacterium]|nr:formate dehydrogenase accessory sulfurtransferase FdhD [candidate division KSB1 bacterium]
MSEAVKSFAVHRLQRKRIAKASDTLAVEEPLEIRLNNVPLAVVMRTPGDDFDLARGFLLTEGIIQVAVGKSSVANCSLQTCELLEVDGARDELGLEIPNVVNCQLPAGSTADISTWQRRIFASSSCGICGRASIDRVRLRANPVEGDWQISFAALQKLPMALRARQTQFAKTGGLHAAALFAPNGEIVMVREDIGRHNAVDKILGWALQHKRLPLSEFGLLVSGRVSFELAQKALLGGVPFLAGISAASSLAVELAEETGITIAGFLRDANAVIYSGLHRIS